MNLLNFATQFSDEASYKLKWKEYRDSQGVICLKYGEREHYNIE